MSDTHSTDDVKPNISGKPDPVSTSQSSTYEGLFCSVVYICVCVCVSCCLHKYFYRTVSTRSQGLMGTMESDQDIKPAIASTVTTSRGRSCRRIKPPPPDEKDVKPRLSKRSRPAEEEEETKPVVNAESPVSHVGTCPSRGVSCIRC